MAQCSRVTPGPKVDSRMALRVVDPAQPSSRPWCCSRAAGGQPVQASRPRGVHSRPVALLRMIVCTSSRGDRAVADRPLDVVRRVYAGMIWPTDPRVTIDQSEAVPHGGRFEGTTACSGSSPVSSTRSTPGAAGKRGNQRAAAGHTRIAPERPRAAFPLLRAVRGGCGGSRIRTWVAFATDLQSAPIGRSGNPPGAPWRGRSIRQRGAGPSRGPAEEDPWPTRRSTS
jgi:hypothetical protein